MVKEEMSSEELLDEPEESDESKKAKKTSSWKESKYTPEELKKAQESVARRKAAVEGSN